MENKLRELENKVPSLPGPKPSTTKPKELELIKIENKKNGEKVVSARELWKFLDIKYYFSSWIKKKIEKYDFIEDEDYTVAGDDYALTLNMAKELAIIENNPAGRLIRKYFIQCEKLYKEKREKELAELKEKMKNKKLGYILTNTNGIRYWADELKKLNEDLQKNNGIGVLEKRKLNECCLYLKAFAFPLKLDKKFGVELEGLIGFNYYE